MASSVRKSLPSPFVFSPSQSWDGNDSTFIIRVGTPAQTFRVLPSTTMHEIWVPALEGCQARGDPSDCGDKRGVYPFGGRESAGFQQNQSTTFHLIGIYNLVFENQLLNESGNGLFGFDTVGLNLQNSGGISLNDSIFGGVATKDIMLGVFGLSPKAANFSNFDNPQPSFMTRLKMNSLIPSVSYGYTAGASYRTPKVLGSLTLGGYDKSRIDPSALNTSTFAFNSDDSRVLTVLIQGIAATETLKGSSTLLSTPIQAVIDSTTPYLWLPQAACDEFADAFGLELDNRTDLYLINDTIHDTLQAQNPTVVISMGLDSNPATMVRISLPYAAFDLQMSFPIFPNETRYFPIRRTTNSSEYTLGRVFLQEAYVVTDYEREVFSVHQALFATQMPQQDIVSILPVNGSELISTNGTSQGENHSLSNRAIAGIVVGSIIAVMLKIMVLVFYRRRPSAGTEADTSKAITFQSPYLREEMPGNERFELEQKPEELPGSIVRHELTENSVVLLISDDAVPHELPAPS